MGRAPCCDKTKVKRGPWSPEEDSKLRGYIEKYGNGGNWITFPLKAAHLPGRTDNDIKNYWNTKLRKKLMSSSSSHSSSAMASPFLNPNSQDVKRPSITISPSSYNPYFENPTKALISNIDGIEADHHQIFPFVNSNYPQDLSLSESSNYNISGASGFSLNHNMCDHYSNSNSFSSDVSGNRSEIMMKQEQIMMLMMIDNHIDQRTKGYNGDFTQGYYSNYINGHGDLKQMISGTGTNSNINMGASGSESASSSSSISNVAENKSSGSLLQHKCLPYFYT
ncbi:hypothetical protein Bca52824_022670 [Brassica carinata]|uniref:Uncharacterized protein n=1 Tax=Brassica carinata TaxID=52824 RepID=A0A8X7VH60_BRACI|nr:hypothetical protein Bca52824_022670 [Brassica carinata]